MGVDQGDGPVADREIRDRNIELAIRRVGDTIGYLRELMKVFSGRLLVGNAAGVVVVLTVLNEQCNLAEVCLFKIPALVVIGLFGGGIVSGILAIAVLMYFLDRVWNWRRDEVQRYQGDVSLPVPFDPVPPDQEIFASLIKGLFSASLVFFVLGLLVGFGALFHL